MNFGSARVFVKGHTTSVTILLNDLNGVECAMVNVSRKILMNLDMMLQIFSVAWHWMLKTCIQLSITRVRSLQLCSMHSPLAVQRKRASNEQQRGRPTTTQVVVRGTQYQRDRWDCLKFNRCHKPQRSRLPRTKSPWARAHGSSVRQRSVRQETAMAGAGTLPGWPFVPKGNRGWRKHRPFFKQYGSHRHQLNIQYHWCRRRKLPSTIQAVMKKFVRLKFLWRRILVTWEINRLEHFCNIGRNWTLPLGLFRTNFTIFPIGWDRTSAYIRRPRRPLSVHFSSHPTHTWRDRPPHRELRALLFSTSAWVLQSPLLTI